MVTYTQWGYNCAACGKPQKRWGEPRRCNFCGAPLCRNCKKNGVCPTDAKLLTLQEQKKLGGILFWMNNGFTSCFLMFLIMLFVVIFAQRLIPPNIFVTLGIIVVIAIVPIVISSSRKAAATKEHEPFVEAIKQRIQGGTTTAELASNPATDVVEPKITSRLQCPACGRVFQVEGNEMPHTCPLCKANIFP